MKTLTCECGNAKFATYTQAMAIRLVCLECDGEYVILTSLFGTDTRRLLKRVGLSQREIQVLNEEGKTATESHDMGV